MATDRNFLIIGHRAHTAPDWKLDDLCGGGGRLDVLVRCVTAALWVSHGLRRDTDVWLLLQGPPAPPVAIHFCGATVRYLNPDERSTAALVRNGLVKLRNRDSVEASPGVTLHRIGLAELLARLPPAVLLDEAGDPLGVLVAVTTRSPAPGMLGAVGEVARYAASQVELAELDASRARLDRAEVLALRAQISPHFIYNALNTIASFVRTDPDRARELILEFADFTRYSFRAAGQYTTLADELRNIDRYLTLERARFGNSLKVTVQVAPEVLNVVVPFLALQPLVENAVRHGFSGRGGGSIELIARDEGSDCVITVEDDGVGMDPDALRAGPSDALSAGMSPQEGNSAHVGLTNVDHRLRAAFGNDYGLVVETAIGAGTKVVMRVPKFRSGVWVSGGAFGVGSQ
mgnify:CR=1 FL=1